MHNLKLSEEDQRSFVKPAKPLLFRQPPRPEVLRNTPPLAVT